MKLTTFLVFVCCIGFISYVAAGPGPAGGGAQIAPMDNAVVTPVKVNTDVSPGANARDNAGVAGNQVGQSAGSGFNSQSNPVDQSSQFGQATASNASATGSSNASGTGQNSSANAFSNGSLHQNSNATSNFSGRGREKMVETSGRELAATEAAEKNAKSEVARKFEPSILDAGISENAKSKASAKVPDFAPVNPVTGATIRPRPSFSQPPIDPIPHDTAPPQVPAAPAISPIASDSVNRDVNPVSSAKVSPLPKD